MCFIRRLGQLFVALSAVIVSSSTAHTLFFKPHSFHLAVGEEVAIPLLNGTFIENENKVTFGRLSDARIIAPDGAAYPIEEGQWVIDESEMTSIIATFGSPGGYIVAVGTKPMMARITPEDFNFYLRYEGLVDDIEERRALGEQGIAAVEKYSKFTKAIIQVGQVESTNYADPVGHPIEILPLKNPSEIAVGESLVVRVLKDSIPLVGELVYASDEESYELTAKGMVEESVAVRTDKDGLATIPIHNSGRWYARVIDLERTGDSEHWYTGILVALGVEEPRVVYESLWATLTFEVL